MDIPRLKAIDPARGWGVAMVFFPVLLVGLIHNSLVFFSRNLPTKKIDLPSLHLGLLDPFPFRLIHGASISGELYPSGGSIGPSAGFTTG